VSALHGDIRLFCVHVKERKNTAGNTKLDRIMTIDEEKGGKWRKMGRKGILVIYIYSLLTKALCTSYMSRENLCPPDSSLDLKSPP